MIGRKKIKRLIIFPMVMMLGLNLAGVRGVNASAAETTLRGSYENIFGKVGSAVTLAQLRDSNTLNFIKKHYNSITMENETKPEALLGDDCRSISVQDARNRGYIIPDGYNESTVPDINFSNVDEVLKIASENNLAVRFHTLIWHHQTPEWFFKVNYQNWNGYVDANTMNKRVEYYVKNVIAHVHSSENGKVVYAWDIANEYLHNTDGGKCHWTEIYGKEGTSPSYLKSAFYYANDMLNYYKIRDNVKLFYNDYNSYEEGDEIVDMLSFINSDKKLCDGVGMQMHLDVSYPSASFVKKTIDKFKNAGLEIQLTELDATTNYKGKTYSLDDQAKYYSELMKMLIEEKESGANITGITFWGLYDDMSWRKDGEPLLFTNMNTPKPAYYAVIKAAENYKGTNTPSNPNEPTNPNKPGNPTNQNSKYWKYEKVDTSWIDPSRPMIAFAFDDGPVSSTYHTTGMRIIDTLRNYKQHATFFYWGNRINDSNKDEIGYANYVGCEIGNHTWTHTDMTKLNDWQIKNEIEQCRAKLQEITGLTSFLVRPPYLGVNNNVKNAVNVPMVTCSLDTGDWNNGNYNTILNKLRTAKDGDILLMHETYDATASAVETAVPELVRRGYQIVSVSELAAVKGINLEKGQVYSSIR